MSPTFHRGDIALVDGIEMTLRSWPESDEGPFLATYVKDGGEVQVMKYAPQTRQDGEPIASTATVTLIQRGGPEVSTLPAPEPLDEEEGYPE